MRLIYLMLADGHIFTTLRKAFSTSWSELSRLTIADTLYCLASASKRDTKARFAKRAREATMLRVQKTNLNSHKLPQKTANGTRAEYATFLSPMEMSAE